jgi:hypothetical protein
MRVSLKSFFIQLAIFSVLSISVLILWQHYASARFQTDLAWPIWAFLLVTTTLIHVKLVRIENPKSFIYSFMAITGIKLFGYLTIILIYDLLKKQEALGFTIFFLVMYFLYTGFEVFTLLKHIKKN